MRKRQKISAWYKGSAFGLALAAAASALTSRGTIWLKSPLTTADRHENIFELIPNILGSAFEDLLLIAAAFFIYKSLAYPFGPRRRRVVITAAYTAFQVMLIVLFALNALSLVRMGFPISTSWWAYLDDSSSLTLRISLFNLLSLSGIAFVASAMVIAPLIAFGVWKLIIRFAPTAIRRSVLAVLGMSAAASALLYPSHVISAEYRTITPLRVALQENMFGKEHLDDVTKLTSNSDWETGGAKSYFNKSIGDKPNIIFIVMDSVSARYIDPANRQSRLASTPNINALMDDGTYFTNFYAHTPVSAKSQLTMATSIYPGFAAEFDTRVLEEAQSIPISVPLKEAGYETAHFMTGDIKLAGIYDFLVKGGFDYVGESRDFECTGVADDMLDRYAHLGDRCSTDAALEWLSSDKRTKPFFMWLWYTNTHHPYYSETPADANAGANKNEQKFLQSLHGTDAQIGRVVEHLRKKEILENSIIILTSDHGESFGERGHFAHGASVFEEQVNIPFLISNPKYFGDTDQPRINDRIGGLVDIAPTILDILNIAQEKSWQGRSLFDPNKPPRAYFFSLIANVMVGYREGDQKFVLRGREGDLVAYNLAKDPEEENPETVSGDRKEAIKSRMASWIKYRKGLFPDG